jgi:DNA repair exonuclease SbcCD ATPase subunit
MNNENYVNYYVEILTSTLTDAVVRNVSLQANARISEEVINNQSKQIEEYKKALAERDIELTNLRNEKGNLANIQQDYENVKSQVSHLDTFRNELIRARQENEQLKANHTKEISELQSKIDFLQLTPAKRKKVTEEKPEVTEVKVNSAIKVPSNLETITKDGGSF